MNIVKAFTVIESFIDNEPGVVSKLGEISTWSLTYTRERGTYKTPLVPGFRIEALSSYNEIGEKIELDPSIANQALLLVKHVFDFTTQNKPNFTASDLVFYIESYFNGEVTHLHVGEMVTTPYAVLPSSLQWESPTLDTVFKIWLSDEYFREDFDDYEIVVVPPFDNIDDFFGIPSEVAARLNAITLEQTFVRVEQFKSYNPETYIKIIKATYYGQGPVTITALSHWPVIIYGESGNNIDAIKDAIIEYILTHSSHDEDEWVRILPELFERTEFAVMPTWYREAIPNMTIQSGVFSSLSRIKEDVEKAYFEMPFYPEQHFKDHASILSFPYRSLMSVVVGGNRNRDNMFYMDEFLTDLINVSTTSLDFNRMTLSTQEWMLRMEQALIMAEQITPLSLVRKPFRKAKRNNKFYIAFMHNDVQYLVVPRYSMS